MAGLPALILVVALTAALVAWRKRRPSAIFSWCWFVVALLPVLGLVRFGNQMFADRFTHLPLSGLAVAVAWGLCASARPGRRAVLVAAGFAVLVGLLAWGTSRQLPFWKDGEALFRHAVAVSPGSGTAGMFLAVSLSESGRADQAEEEYRRVIATHPRLALARRDLGVLLHTRGRYREALTFYEEARRLDPSDARTVLYQGQSLLELGSRPEAEAAFRQALALAPSDAEIMSNLGTALAEEGRGSEAEDLFLRALAADPRQALARSKLERLRGRRDR